MDFYCTCVLPKKATRNCCKQNGFILKRARSRLGTEIGKSLFKVGVIIGLIYVGKDNDDSRLPGRESCGGGTHVRGQLS